MGKWIFIALVIVLGFVFWQQGSEARKLKAEVAELNKKAPFMIDPNVRLDKVELQDKKITMRITFPNMAVASTGRSTAAHQLEELTKKAWCKHKGIRKAIDRDYVMSVAANLADNSPLFQISVGRSDCTCVDQFEQGRDMCVIR